MDTERDEEILELSTLLTEIIRRMGAAYGSPEDWRRDITTAVRVTEEITAAVRVTRG